MCNVLHPDGIDFVFLNRRVETRKVVPDDDHQPRTCTTTLMVASFQFCPS